MPARLNTHDITLVALFAALTAAGAWVALPLAGPVPFTLQVFFVLLTGLTLGPRLGSLSVLIYLLSGLIAPVYAGGSSGIGTLFGPAGGYLWGFVGGAALAGSLSQRRDGRQSTPQLIFAALAGLLPIYGLGAAWLALSLHVTSFKVVAVGGVLQFVPLDVLKALLAVAAAKTILSLPLGRGATSRSR